MYVIIGASGNTGSIVANRLLDAGKQVRVVSRSEDHLKPLLEKGAEPAIGDLEDKSFTNQLFKDARAAYVLVPPKMDAQDFRSYQKQVGENIAEGLAKNQMGYAVFLSSYGAHLPDEAGVVSGLYHVENSLKNVPGLNTLSLRAGFFLENFYANIGLIKQQGILGGFPIDSDIKIPMVHTRDIAGKVVDYLLNPDFEGFVVDDIAGAKDYSMQEAASILGNAIGKDDLPYVRFPYEDAQQGMVQMGMSPSLAEQYVKFCKSLNEGKLYGHYVRNHQNTSQKSLEDFTKEFSMAYSA